MFCYPLRFVFVEKERYPIMKLSSSHPMRFTGAIFKSTPGREGITVSGSTYKLLKPGQVEFDGKLLEEEYPDLAALSNAMVSDTPPSIQEKRVTLLHVLQKLVHDKKVTLDATAHQGLVSLLETGQISSFQSPQNQWACDHFLPQPQRGPIRK